MDRQQCVVSVTSLCMCNARKWKGVLPGVFVAGHLRLGSVLWFPVTTSPAPPGPPASLDYVSSVDLVTTQTVLDPPESRLVLSLSLLARVGRPCAPLQVLRLDLAPRGRRVRVKLVIVIVRRVVVVVIVKVLLEICILPV